MIIDTCPNLTLQLVVDGTPLDEYGDEDATHADNTTCSAFVEAVSGSNFGVKVTCGRRAPPVPQDKLRIKVYLDGKNATGKICHITPKHGKRTPHECTMHGIMHNTSRGTVEEKFTFSDLDTDDGPVDEAKRKDFKHMGEIKIECHWARQNGARYVRPGQKSFKSAFTRSVPEKCLKGRAISSRAGVGPAEHVNLPAVHGLPIYDPYGRRPFATFIFKYRSRRDLQIEGIIERSPTPVPLEDRDPDDLTPAEARELIRRMRERQDEQILVKKEGEREKRARSATVGADANDPEDIIVTGESSARKRSRRSGDSATDVIDLTED